MEDKIAKRLEQLRIDHNMSQAELAQQLGITENEIDAWEHAKGSPSAGFLVELSRIYKMSIDELLFVQEDVPEYDEDTATRRGGFQSAQEDMPPVDYSETEVLEPKHHLNRAIWHFPCLVMIIIAFLCLGYFANAWHPAWILFLIIPIYETLLEAVERKDANRFGMPIVALLVFLLLGFFADAWHPGWTVFLIVPIYYGLIAWIRALGKGVDKAVSDYMVDEDKDSK